MVKGNGLISLSFVFSVHFFRLCFVFVSSEKKNNNHHHHQVNALIWLYIACYEPSLCAHKHIHAHHMQQTKVIESRYEFSGWMGLNINIHFNTFIVYACACVLHVYTQKGEKVNFVKGVHKIICSDSTWECKRIRHSKYTRVTVKTATKM